MLAWMKKISVFGLLAIAIAGLGLIASHGGLEWALGALLLLIFAHAIILAVEFVLLSVANRDDPTPAPTLSELVRAWWGEVLVAPQVFCWQQPFRSQSQSDHLPAAGRGKTGIVFVHGFLCNRGFWNPWLKRLRRLDVPFVAVNLEPPFASIDELATLIDQAVQSVEAATATRPLIVAHSMGGLAARAWLEAYRADSRVCRVVTIGTPHRGTLLARLAFTTNTRQMRLDGAWLRALAQRERGGYSGFTCFYSHCDNVVLPASSATLPGADNRHVAAVAHVHLARQEAVLSEVLRLATDSARPGH